MLLLVLLLMDLQKLLMILVAAVVVRLHVGIHQDVLWLLLLLLLLKITDNLQRVAQNETHN